MSIVKKVKEAVKIVLKKRRGVPDMPEDPKDLARALFWENDRKRLEKAQGKKS